MSRESSTTATSLAARKGVSIRQYGWERRLTGRELEQDHQMLSICPGQRIVSGTGCHDEIVIRLAQEDERAVVQYHTSRAFPSRNSE